MKKANLEKILFNVDTPQKLNELLVELNIEKYKNDLLVIYSDWVNINVIKFLFSINANPNSLGGEAFINACARGKKELVELFIKNNVNINIKNGAVFIDAALNDRLDILEVLYKNGAKIESQNYGALICAAKYSKLETVKLLISFGSKNLINALMIARQSKRIEIIDFLESAIETNKEKKALNKALPFKNKNKIKNFKI